MATVVDLARGGVAVDKTLDKQNRTNAGDPNGSLTPQFSGEIVLDTTNEILWRAMSMVNTSWVVLTGSKP